MDEIGAQKKAILMKIFKAVMLMNEPYVKNLTLVQFNLLMQDDTVITELIRLIKLYRKYKGSNDQHVKFALQNCSRVQYINYLKGKYSLAVLISEVLYTMDKNKRDPMDFNAKACQDAIDAAPMEDFSYNPVLYEYQKEK